MINSDCSVVLGDQRALARGHDEPVVPNTGCEGDQALSETNGETGWVSAALGLVPPIWPRQRGSEQIAAGTGRPPGH